MAGDTAENVQNSTFSFSDIYIHSIRNYVLLFVNKKN